MRLRWQCRIPHAPAQKPPPPQRLAGLQQGVVLVHGAAEEGGGDLPRAVRKVHLARVTRGCGGWGGGGFVDLLGGPAFVEGYAMRFQEIQMMAKVRRGDAANLSKLIARVGLGTARSRQS